jgi:hypothetical protein
LVLVEKSVCSPRIPRKFQLDNYNKLNVGKEVHADTTSYTWVRRSNVMSVATSLRDYLIDPQSWVPLLLLDLKGLPREVPTTKGASLATRDRLLVEKEMDQNRELLTGPNTGRSGASRGTRDAECFFTRIGD